MLETIRVLHLEQHFSKTSIWRSALSHRPIFSTAFPLQSHFRQSSRCGGKLSARPELDHVERLKRSNAKDSINKELLAYLAR